MNAEATWGPPNEPGAPRRGVCDPRGPYHEFARRVRGRHYAVAGTVTCACGRVAFLCPELVDAHEIFGDHVPWVPPELLPLRPPTNGPRPAPHPVTFLPPRPRPRPRGGDA